ncbi:hypothetical protein CVT25_001428 [Psilocybe cyanescens]|uniref:Cytochrome P450 n=1 Tax=Psilocybe cyanescens TaxID=93625 RepID=A0A409WNQ0_PSICY|nr:hypothetical protein CVT25_001428 [Psilocybe cyanescens]
MTLSYRLTTFLQANPVYTVIVGVFAYAVISNALRARFLNRNPKNLPRPPGPKGYPLIGNLFDMRKGGQPQWVAYDEWFKKYGDMVYFELLGQPVLVLGSLKRTNDLFEKRSSNYSDRIRMPMVLELMQMDYNMAMLPYGQWWRRHRRVFNEHFHHNTVWRYCPIQLREARVLLFRLLVSPENFLHHIRHSFAATIMSAAYGISVEDSGDPHITNAEKALAGLAAAGIPGSFLVDLIPALKYIPSWFPGAGFQQKAAEWRKVNNELAQKPFKQVEDEMQNGTALPSLAATLIERLPDKSHDLYAEERKIAEDVAAIAYIVQAFFLAMALYPEVQKKAQAELDAVIGGNRLPDFSDRESLPYINALLKESVRWYQVTPLAVGHMCSEDDEYDGYFIPRGTIVMGNAWSILHDPEVFSNPFEYNPDRYLKDGKLDPNARNPDCAAFGFGRRICPGRHMSDNGLYSIVASVLSVFDIKAPVDDLGNPVELKQEFTTEPLLHFCGTVTCILMYWIVISVRYPVPFNCIIKPRGSTAEALIREGIEVDH